MQREFPAVRYFRQRINAGPAAARNRGWREAAGEIIAYTDDDCLVPLDWLSRLEDGFLRHPEAVGVGGYHSPYDYVYQNVQHSVVWVENGLNYYAYGREYTNSTTRSRKPDYVIVLQTAWWGGDPHYPELVASPEWDQNYRIVYEDSEGRVYQRRSNVP